MPNVRAVFLRHLVWVKLLAVNLVSCGLVYQVLYTLIKLCLVGLCLCDAGLVLIIELLWHVLLLRVLFMSLVELLCRFSRVVLDRLFLHIILIQIRSRLALLILQSWINFIGEVTVNGVSALWGVLLSRVESLILGNWLGVSHALLISLALL